MANLPESSNFDSGVYQIETTDPVLGGPSGVTNTPLKNLTNRTRWLKDQVTALASAIGSIDLSPYALLASPTFTGNPKGPTPAQFDNDTSLATTEFVQRALGNLAGQGGYSANATIGPGDIGKRINTTSASNITLTVPDPTSYPVGSTFLVHNTGGGGVTTLVPAVAGTLNNGGTLGNIALSAQSYVWLTKTDANYWLAIGGSAHLGKTAEFASSLTGSSGYQKLPSGLILQSGHTGTNSSGVLSLTFPIAFPTASIIGLATSWSTGNTVFSTINNTQTGMTVYSTVGNTGAASPNAGFTWLAIGY